MNSKEIRQKWLDFFQSKGHLIVPSKNLIPQNDPSLLWINSGVATLKDYFTGKKIPPHNRLTNSQKAIRTNDIENVGVTARHHTFFEMLGNFSIGDYFKVEAIQFAYEFLLEVLKLDKNKLYFTYYNEDEVALKTWLDCGVDPSHMIPGGRDTNFWDVGSGPCGPCSEIFYDRGEKYDTRGIELLKEDIENDRYIEIWNIVFSQFNNDGEGNYTELKQKNIDTGAGFERIVAVMQDAPTNYDSDLFAGIIGEIEKFTPYRYDKNNYFTKEEEQREINTNFKIIADHIRTVANAIADGAQISNVGRGYIIRRLIRRSVYKGMQLKIEGLFLYKLVQAVHDSLPFEYDVEQVSNNIKEEEILFHKTIENGRLLLEKHIDDNKKIFDGEIAFKLFETYGFPIELTIEILAKKNITVDMESYENSKNKHMEASRGSKHAGMAKAINSLALIKGKNSIFVGYDFTSFKSNVIHLYDNENELEKIDKVGYVVLDKTPFYATSGGQKHDEGYILQNGNKIKILDVFKDKHGNHIHYVEGILDKKTPVECFVDEEKRLACARNHSATHLLFSQMRKVLGNHIEQLGSDITEERFTFDFPSDSKPSDEQITQLETNMREIIKRNIERKYVICTIEEAKKYGAYMTIEETEYMDPKAVRMVIWGDVTADLCGGTHLPNSGILEDFKIAAVEKKQAGIYRLRVITSKKLVKEFMLNQIDFYKEELENIIRKIKTLDPEYDLPMNFSEDLEKKLKQIHVFIEKAREDFKNISKCKTNVEFDYSKVILEKIENHEVYQNYDIDSSQIKVIASTLREKYQEAIIVLGSKDNEKILLTIASKKIDSNKLFKKLASELNGRGGGNQILAMGKVDNNPEKIKIILTDELKCVQ